MPGYSCVRTDLQSTIEPHCSALELFSYRLSGFGEDNLVDHALGCPCELTWTI